MPSEAASSPTIDSFIRSALRSGLLQREELQTAVRSLPAELRADPQALADVLVQQNRLSRFQAQKILKGAPLGLVLGPFQILAPIGKGGMGAVYLARDTRADRQVALKILPPRRAKAEERLLARFQREMAISQRVSHPCIARTYEAGAYQGVYYIAMEYIPGRTLYRLVMEEGSLKVSRAAHLFAEVAAGLVHAHAQGVIHRDLKPSNIMVTPNDHARILDLGLALVEGEVAGAVDDVEREVIGGKGYVVGSMDYIAPEQTQDPVGIDARADIYALGCVLYFALTGRPPFPGGTGKDKMRRHRREEPPELIQLNPSVPLGFALVVKRMMAKNRKDRFHTADTLRQALLEWTTGEVELPVDQQEDPWYQQAIEALKRAQFASEDISTLIVARADAPPQPRASWHEWFRKWLSFLTPSEGDYLPLVAGIVGFWVVLLLLLGVLLLLR